MLLTFFFNELFFFDFTTLVTTALFDLELLPAIELAFALAPQVHTALSPHIHFFFFNHKKE